MDTIDWIVWSEYENAYLSNLGHTWKKFEHIPHDYRHLVNSPRPSKRRKLIMQCSKSI